MKKTTMKNFDLMDLFATKSKQSERIGSRSVVNMFELYLSGQIESPDEYIEWYDTIRHLSENDIVKIYINSVGGDLYSAIQFLRVLRDTEATVIASVEGACMSAATIIFMCADVFDVSEHSVFMFHNYSSGVFGKGGEMYDQLTYERNWSEALLRDVYKDFLTDDEVTSILNNKDIWMGGDEVLKRLAGKKAKMEGAKDTSSTAPKKKVKEILSDG